MLRTLALLAATAVATTVAATPALAEGDFSAGSEAKEWGLFGEEKARFTATVTDAVCALTGDCPEDCGAGARQMVLIRDADGAMIIAAKNTQPAFTGATVDLAPYCGQSVEVDGVMVGDPEITGQPTRIYMVQTVRAEGGEPAKTNRWTKEWRAAHPDAPKGPWFRNDPRVTALIGKEGYLGLGLETDAAFIEEWF